MAACFIYVLMFVPVIIVNAAGRVGSRLVLIAMATAVFLLALSSFTKARTVEIFVSGAT